MVNKLILLGLSVIVLWSVVAAAETGRTTPIHDALAEPAQPVAAGDPFVPNPPPATLFVLSAVLSDNGDDDGWADTNETIAMRIVVSNRTGLDLTGVVAQVSTDDPKIACMLDSRVTIGALDHAETRLVGEAFFFTVADYNRAAVEDEFSVEFTVSLSADGLEALPDQTVVLDLDLDVSGGTGPTTYLESFENGFDSFVPMPLDEPLNPPDSDPTNLESGVRNADGYRCQYSDPEWEYASSFNTNASGPNCFPNPTGAPDASWFRVTDNRAFSGDSALHWGALIDEVAGLTSPIAQLEAMRSEHPINLAWESTCSDSAKTCASDLDCPVGESCELAASELSFKHQISLHDHRIQGAPYRSSERAIVQAQLADGEGAAVGDWIKLYPYMNAYDSQANNNFFNCTFDPIDDGNTEEDFFDPTDPFRSLGPSSTCFPEYSFAHQGGVERFDPLDIGDAPDGPGLRGSSVVGTWVEARVDLGRFRGRRLRLRFLVTGLKRNLGSATTWEDVFHFNPDPRDDGWFIDDVSVTDTLVTPAVAIVDAKPNINIKADFDFDNVAESCDCAPNDPTAWDMPGVVGGLMLVGQPSQGTTQLTWDPPLAPGGSAPQYGVISSAMPHDFVNEADCTMAGSQTQLTDLGVPESGAVTYFLVRASNACTSGPIAGDSAGNPRPVRDCP